ncbi:hydroxyacid oxidase 1 [Stylonychia lemnae]|uniref:Hydroxyacid oxidase 1 n=1 Tax=Stylonychia lemnae TaxID=5949 RepID=A0A078B7F1_STYLE|nr:hydroxyacid oxidase 1 [Stylonychia lemnae]|eukprot:CDW90415.1 hydroxyacid oxidase 1 [Stylonychia lemnae]
MDRAVSVKDFEQLASENLHKHAYDYYRAGANAAISLNDNVEKFRNIPLKTRTFVDPKKFKGLETTIMGQKVSSPICIASTSFQKMTNEDGELAMARGAQAFNHTTFMLSSWSNVPLEDVAQQAPDCFKMFQIYLSKIPDVNKDLWIRVKNSGFTALGLTTDTQMLGKRENDLRNGFSLPEGLNMANYNKYNKTHGQNQDIKSSGKDSGLSEYVKNHKDQNIGWEIINEIKKISGLPVIAKGIMCKEDALTAIEYGADALFVSNHGARQLDTTPATIEVLGEVIEVLKEKGLDKKIEVYFDGGIRRGTDVFKALAIGAKAVFLGRPILWAMAAGGQKGVEKVLKIMNDELKETMIRTGCYCIEDISKNGVKLEEEKLVYDREEYAKKDFWNDRFKESKGFFDWYAKWDQIKPKFLELFPLETHRHSSFLMVGCGNSKLSEEMYKEGFQQVTNMDISDVVLQKMQEIYYPEKCPTFEQMIHLILLLIRVPMMHWLQSCFQSKMLYIVWTFSGNFKEFSQGDAESFKAIKAFKFNKHTENRVERQTTVLCYQVKRFIEAEQIKEESKDPRKKLLRLMMKAKAKKQQDDINKAFADQKIIDEAIAQKDIDQLNVQTANAEQQSQNDLESNKYQEIGDIPADQDESKVIEQDIQKDKENLEQTKNPNYNPKRQEFVMMYVIYK